MGTDKARSLGRGGKAFGGYMRTAKGREMLARMASKTMDNIADERKRTATPKDEQTTPAAVEKQQPISKFIETEDPNSEAFKNDPWGRLSDKIYRAPLQWRDAESEEMKRAEWIERANDLYRRKKKATAKEELAKVEMESKALSFELIQPAWTSRPESGESVVLRGPDSSIRRSKDGTLFWSE